MYRKQEGVSICSHMRGKCQSGFWESGEIGSIPKPVTDTSRICPDLYAPAYVAVSSAGFKMQGGIPDGGIIAFPQADAIGRGLLLSRKMAAVTLKDDLSQGSW